MGRIWNVPQRSRLFFLSCTDNGPGKASLAVCLIPPSTAVKHSVLTATQSGRKLSTVQCVVCPGSPKSVVHSPRSGVGSTTVLTYIWGFCSFCNSGMFLEASKIYVYSLQMKDSLLFENSWFESLSGFEIYYNYEKFIIRLLLKERIYKIH